VSDFETLVDPMLEMVDLDYEGLRVTAIGGGHGLAQALQAIGEYADGITAVVSVADDGGSSGRLGPALGIPPPGDSRRALLALSPGGSWWHRVLAYRFDAADVAGHSLGNLILAGLCEELGGLEEALRTLGRLLGARGEVVPVAATGLRMEARIGGEVVKGQVAVARARGRIEEIRLLPAEVRAAPSAVEAVMAADQIVLGPGSLFTSVIAALKVPGMVEALNAAGGRLTYVCNLTTQDGETLGMDAAAHVEALVRHTGIRAPDAVVTHQGRLAVPPGLEPVAVDHRRLGAMGCRVESAELADPGAPWPQHDPARLGAVLRRLA
jgi:uncharacterized cofD-like protein